MRERGRFNAVNCGRRWGKSSVGIFLLIYGASAGKPVAWFSPNYKDLSEIWKIAKESLGRAGLIRHKSEVNRQLILANGAVIDFWSLVDPESGRGRKYKLIVVDEVAKIKGFMDIWQQTLRATLTDYMGEAWLFSTPKGRTNDWYQICTEDNLGFTYHHAPTHDNPYMNREELAAAERDLPSLVYRQEYLAEFVDFTDGLFFNEFDNRFILRGTDQVEIDTTAPLYITFDFNIDPTTALLFQVFEEPGGGIFFIDEIMVTGGTARLCEELLIYKNHPGMLLVTGDYSGNSGSTTAGLGPGGEYQTDYSIIVEMLDLNNSQLIDTRTPNKRLVLSRNLINFAFKAELIWVNARCEQLISDIITAIPTSAGKLVKDRKFYKNDALDAFRYGVHTQCEDGINSLRYLKEICDA